MPLLSSRFQHEASARTLSLTLLGATIVAYVGTSNRHALLTSAAAWLSICVHSSSRVGIPSLRSANLPERASWAAGFLLAVTQLLERAESIWWAKALLPFLIYTCAAGGILNEPLEPPSSPAERAPIIHGHSSTTALLVITSSGLAALYPHSGLISVVALGLSNSILSMLAFHLVKRAQHQLSNGTSVIYSANGLLSPPTSADEQWTCLLRDVSAAAAATTGIAALSLESFHFDGPVLYGLLGQAMGSPWSSGQVIVSILWTLAIVSVHVVMLSSTLSLIRGEGAFFTSLVPLAAALFSQLLLAFSVSRFYFAALCATATLTFLDEQAIYSSGPRMKFRFGKSLALIALLSFATLAVYSIRQSTQATPFAAQHPSPLRPLQSASTKIHPIKALVDDAQTSWTARLQSQSGTLGDAVAEYRRRYGMPPPPHFDKWYAFAKRKNVKFIDDYDTIYHSLLPFWGLSPATIRARAREALGYGENYFMGLLIRDGKAALMEGGPDWLQQATAGMLEQFVEYLPDMDLAFNTQDEPRVVVPYDELSRLVEIALQGNIATAATQTKLRTSFSTPPKDVSSGKRISEVMTTRFNNFAHQHTWLSSKLSCSPESPARALEEWLASDNFTAYALGDMAFIYNQTAFSDICNSPSFARTHGFFDRPNAFSVVHELFPIFSQSKMSSFQDILFPSPWYWNGMVEYEQSKDPDWSKKTSKLWWRGSTTGGFSRAGGWKRQHRQQLVRKVNALDTAKVLVDSNAGATNGNRGSNWITKDVSRHDYKHLMDVHFSHVGQCDPGDCDAQREFFEIVPPADQQDAWRYKYLLDMDGNAFSGRFYAFLSSHSLIFKMAVFREWHEEWIKPWLHYVPLSLMANDTLEAVRYFDGEEEGRSTAVDIAEAGREWASQALRRDDFEVWFFRLLLEYGRLVDDNRERIGYSGA